MVPFKGGGGIVGQDTVQGGQKELGHEEENSSHGEQWGPQQVSGSLTLTIQKTENVYGIILNL